MKVGSLFAGIGGFDLAAEWAGWETAWYSEIDPYACAVMKKRFPGAISVGDITTLNGRTLPMVEVLCGGFPCQDISFAGKGAGLAGERSGLWSHYARLIEETAPRWVVIENVSALRSRGLDHVLGALAALGYDAEWHCIPAAYVGAPHRRDRVWIVAWRADADKPRPQGWLGAILRERAGQWAAGAVGASAFDTDAHCGRLEVGAQFDCQQAACSADRDSCGQHADRLCAAVADAPSVGQREPAAQADAESGRREARQEPRGSSWWLSEPDVGRVAHGIPSRVDRLRCLGNAIVPQVAHIIFQAINEAERGAE